MTEAADNDILLNLFTDNEAYKAASKVAEALQNSDLDMVMKVFAMLSAFAIERAGKMGEDREAIKDLLFKRITLTMARDLSNPTPFRPDPTIWGRKQ